MSELDDLKTEIQLGITALDFLDADVRFVQAEKSHVAWLKLNAHLEALEAERDKLRAFAEWVSAPDRNLDYDIQSLGEVRQAARNVLGLENDPQTGKVIPPTPPKE